MILSVFRDDGQCGWTTLRIFNDAMHHYTVQERGQSNAWCTIVAVLRVYVHLYIVYIQYGHMRTRTSHIAHAVMHCYMSYVLWVWWADGARSLRLSLLIMFPYVVRIPSYIFDYRLLQKLFNSFIQCQYRRMCVCVGKCIDTIEICNQFTYNWWTHVSNCCRNIIFMDDGRWTATLNCQIQC